MKRLLSVRLALITSILLLVLAASLRPQLADKQPLGADSPPISVPVQQEQSTTDKQSLMAQCGQTLTAGNLFYRVYIQKAAGCGKGLFTVTTGPNHPSGAGLNLLYGAGTPGTSFTTIRSYTSGIDYIQGMAEKTSVNGVTFLDAYGTVTLLGTTGFRTKYVLPGPPTTPDALIIIQDVIVRGSTLADSMVEVTTKVTNRGATPAQIGIRYLWDVQNLGDDGPTFQGISPTGSVDIREKEFRLPEFKKYIMANNEAGTSPQFLNIVGTAKGASSYVPTPTQPDVLQFACWPKAFNIAFDHKINATDDIATTAAPHQTGTGGGDSAVLYYFGADSGSALTIPPGETHSVTALVASSTAQEEPCDCAVKVVGPDTACAGEEVTFTVTKVGDGVVHWHGFGGDPSAAIGDTYTTKFTTSGEKTVTATCETSTDSKTVKVVAVASVTFEKINSPLSANPNAGGGQRIFPDQDNATDMKEHRTVKVIATVAPVAANVPVYFRVFDMDDPSTNDAPVDSNGPAGNDNKNDGETATGGMLDMPMAMTNAAGVAMVTLTVSRQPGNNFRVTATCNQNYSNGLMLRAMDGSVIEDSDGAALPTVRGKVTELLTVWRRLHVEIDSMGRVTGNFLSGNIIDLQRITGSQFPIDNTTANRVIVDNNLRDGSSDLDSIPADNGRFENGTIFVGPNVIPNVDGNGQDNIDRTAGINIDAIPLSFFAVDNDSFGNSTMSGTITHIAKLSNTQGTARVWVLYLNVIGHSENPIDWPDFVGGTISIGAGPNMTITASSATTRTVEVSEASLRVPYRVYDDDMPNGTDVPNPDRSRLAEAYAPAYVEPRFGSVGVSQGNLQFIANIAGGGVSAGWMFDAVGQEANPKLWTVYLRGSFQHTTNIDGDPNGEGAVLGSVDMIGGQGANIYEEVLRPAEFTPIPAMGISEAYTVAHEVGHLFGGLHNDGCPAGTSPATGCPAALLMASTSIRMSPRFNGVTLNKIRSASHP